MRLKALLRSLRALEAGEQWALVPATLQMVVARAALRALPLRKVLERADLPVKGISDASPLNAPTLRRIRAIERVGHGLFPRSPCLTQAIVAQRLLRTKGYASDLRIGVRKGHGQPLEAHAWVEYQGVVVIGARGLSWEHVALPRFESIMTDESKDENGANGCSGSEQKITPALTERGSARDPESEAEPFAAFRVQKANHSKK